MAPAIEKLQAQVLPHEGSIQVQVSSTPGGKRSKILLIIAVACSTIAFQNILFQRDYYLFGYGTRGRPATSLQRDYHCKFPLPKLLSHFPPSADDRELASASSSLSKYLSKRVSEDDIDSLSIAIVTPGGTVFERGYGVLKANETDIQKQGSVDRDSIYRIASISKMFTVLETLILRDRGALNWDDPIEKFLPEVSYPSYGWSDHLDGATYVNATKPRITLRQLASHMSGVGRDYPPSEIEEWPTNSPLFTRSKRNAAPKNFPERTYQNLLTALAKYPLVNLPYEYPIYSNSGIDLLGQSNIAANKMIADNNTTEPQTHKELVKRDIFDPVGLHNSFFRVPANSTLRDHIAVPSSDTEWADMEFDDVDDPAGGQYSSLGDLVTIMKTFLSPTAKGGVISQHVVREWLRPLHTWIGGFQQVGAPWEISVLTNGPSLYMKGGNLPGYHSEFVLNPDYGYGVVVLVTGKYSNTVNFVSEAISRFQPAFEKILRKQVRKAYTGKWSNGDDTAVVSIIDGELFLTKLVIRNIDLLDYIQKNTMGFSGKPQPIALWSTGRPGEFRLAIGRAGLNNDPNVGCMPYWATIDPGVNSRGAPLDLIYWDGDTLVYPSAGVRFARKHQGCRSSQ